MFAVAPPGEAASSINPTASSGGSLNSSARPIATHGSTAVCRNSPVNTARG